MRCRRRYRAGDDEVAVARFGALDSASPRPRSRQRRILSRRRPSAPGGCVRSSDDSWPPGRIAHSIAVGAGWRVEHDDEIEEVVRIGEPRPVDALKATRPSGSRPRRSTAARTASSERTRPSPEPRELPRQEQRRSPTPQPTDERPLGRRHVEERRRQAGSETGPASGPIVCPSGPNKADSPRFPPCRRNGTDRRLIILAVFALIVVGVVAAILISRSGGDRQLEARRAPTAAKKSKSREPKKALQAPKQTVKKGEKLTAVVETSCGTFEIALATKEAPKTVNSFAYLAEEGFYDELTFHRIVAEFVIQGGDPEGTGSGGPGYSVVEKPPANLAYTKGVVAMAKSSAEPPGTSGSQFFVVTGADAGLPPEYALVGKVDKGMDVVERIGKLGTPAEQPKQTVLIDNVTIEKG